MGNGDYDFHLTITNWLNQSDIATHTLIVGNEELPSVTVIGLSVVKNVDIV